MASASWVVTAMFCECRKITPLYGSVERMHNKKTLLAVALLLVGLCAAFVRAQSPFSPPDLSGKWALVEGDPAASSPLGNEGSITQDSAAIAFRSLRIPFDGSKATSQEGPFFWQYEGRWVGFAFVVSMKTTSGANAGTFQDLMVVTPSGPDTMTMGVMRTPKASGKVMHTFTLKYKKS